MKKRFLPLSMLLITMVLAQAGHVANATGIGGKYIPRSNTKATVSSYMKSIRANQETGLIDPSLMLKAQKAAQTSMKGSTTWDFMGPDNYGSLTRAMIYDETDNTGNTLLIGTMGGHLFKSTDGGITMQQIGNDFNAMISDMVQYDGITYVATGDGRNSFAVNPLSDYGYETGFVGTGIWKFNGTTATQIPSTDPKTNEGWEFVNELAVSGTSMNRIFAATNGGLRYSTDNGETWTTFIEGDASSVKMSNFGVGLASVNDSVYRININGAEMTKTLLMSDENEDLLPTTPTAIKVLAIAPSDANYMYVGYVNVKTSSSGTTTFETGDIHYSTDGGNTWAVALTGATSSAAAYYDIFGSRGYIDNAMEVFPNNPQKILVGGKNIWVLEYAAGSSPQGGVYVPTMISDGELNELAQLMMYSYNYAHCGIQSFQFGKNSNVFFVGTEGGVFKGTYAQGEYSFSNCNRYFITSDVHTSVTRMFGVGVGGYTNRVIGGCLDHGTIFILGEENINNITTGSAIFPNSDPTSGAAGSGHGVFKDAYAGGQCAISTIDPAIMFVTSTGSLTTPLYRTETSGYDYDMANFYNESYASSKVITNSGVFRTPFAMYENYNDQYSQRTTLYAANDSIEFLANGNYIVKPDPIHNAGEKVKVHSNIGGFPFEYVLQQDVNKGDTIFDIKDIISTTMVCGVKDNIYMTKNSHYFGEVSDWWRIGNIKNLIPTAVAISNNGNTAIVGTSTGELFRISNLRMAVTAAQACIDSTGCITVFDTLDNSLFAGRAITSVSINDNNVLVTAGNYGNNDYVFLSNNNGDSFVSKQGNLPKAPVYSCLIEKEEGTLIVGTEYGLYIYAGNNVWEHNSNVMVPVTDLKQAIVRNREVDTTFFGYDIKAVDTTVTITPIYDLYGGVENEGIIYAATYGNGIIKCEDYKVEGGGEVSIAENNIDENALNLSVYPNPVVGTANVRFELSETQTVKCDVYDLSGRLVSSRMLGTYGQGSHNVSFSADNLSCGSYIIRIQAGNKTQSSKMLVF